MRFAEKQLWIESKELVTKIYAVTRTFPKEERYEMIRTLRNSAVAASSNIAKALEGMGADDLEHHLNLAKKQHAEIASILLIAKELNYLEEEKLHILMGNTDDCQRMSFGFIRYLRKQRNEKANSGKK